MSEQREDTAQASSAIASVIRAPDAAEEVVEALFARRPRVVKARVIRQLEELDQVVGRAHDEADALLEQARAEAERIRGDARAHGEAQAQKRSLELLGQAQTLYDNAIRDAESDLLDMAFGLAGRIVGASLELEPDLMRILVRDVVERARGRRRVELRVHPADAPTLVADRDALVDTLGGAVLSIEADDSLSRGSCVLRTDAGDVDARLETRLDAIRASIRGE